MSEELYGHEAVEHNAGLSPMPEAHPEPSESTDGGGRDIGSDHSSLRDAADGLRESREAPPDVIEYHKADKDGRRTDKPSDPRETIKLARGAEDLAAYREQKAKIDERISEEAVRQHVDSLRKGGTQADQQQYSPEQQQAQKSLNEAYQQQPQQTPQPTRDEQLIATAKNPQFRENVKFTQHAIQQRMQQIDSQLSQMYSAGQDDGGALTTEWSQLSEQLDQANFVERCNVAMAAGYSPKIASMAADNEVLQFFTAAVDGNKRDYEKALQEKQQDAEDLLNFTMACFRHGLPELSNCKTLQEINQVVDSIKMNNPVRGQALASWFAGLGQAANHAVRVREEIAHNEKAKFQTWATNEDNLFRSRNREFISPETQKTVALEAFEYLAEKGISNDEAIQLHAGEAVLSLRHHAAQEILWDAMRYARMQKAKANLPNRRAPAPAHVVMRPGSSETRIDQDRAIPLPDSFSGLGGLRDAAQILSNRRSRRR